MHPSHQSVVTPHHVTRQGLLHFVASLLLVCGAQYLSGASTHSHTSAPTPSTLLSTRTLNFSFGTRPLPYACWPATSFVTLIIVLLSVLFPQKPKIKHKTLPAFLPLRKKMLIEKLSFFFFLFQIQGTKSVDEPVGLSVSTPRFRIKNTASCRLLDIARLRQLTSLTSAAL